MHRFGALVLLVAVLVSSCGKDDKKADSKTARPARESLFHYTIPSTIELTVQGPAHHFSYKGPADMEVLRLVDENQDPPIHILTVGSGDPVTDPTGLIVQEAFANLNNFRKDGTYTVPLEGTSGSEGQNKAHVVLFRLGPDKKPTDAARYELVREPCTVVIKKLGDSGSIVCPVLKDTADRTARLVLRWTGTGAHKDIKAATTPPTTGATGSTSSTSTSAP